MQSSWTKHGIERESPESAIPSNQISEHPDSTCGIVIRSLQTQPIRDTNNHKPQPYTGIHMKLIQKMSFQNIFTISMTSFVFLR